MRPLHCVSRNGTTTKAQVPRAAGVDLTATAARLRWRVPRL